MGYAFVMDERLGIPLPHFDRYFEEFSEKEQAEILLRWENIRGTIPERVKEIERVIIAKQEQLNVEESFSASCRLNSEIAELASAINDLNLWFRVNQDISARVTHH